MLTRDVTSQQASTYASAFVLRSIIELGYNLDKIQKTSNINKENKSTETDRLLETVFIN